MIEEGIIETIIRYSGLDMGVIIMGYMAWMLHKHIVGIEKFKSKTCSAIKQNREEIKDIRAEFRRED